MPSGGGPVYQPTTVSYEPRSTSNVLNIGNSNGGGGALHFLGPSSSLEIDTSLRILRKQRPQLVLFFGSLLFLLTGMAMVASGFVDWPEDNKFFQNIVEIKDSMQSGEITTEREQIKQKDVMDIDTDRSLSLGIILGGVLMIVLGLSGICFYLKLAGWLRKCLVCSCSLFDKKQSLARQLHCQNSGVGSDSGCGHHGILALNPSTDPLVSHTQYAPVSELPSLRAEEEERRNLMPDNKDCLSSAEESDRMLEPDPRIVLRPLGRVEEP